MSGLRSHIESWKNTGQADIDSHRLSVAILDQSEHLINHDPDGKISREEWLEFLHITGKPLYLTALGTSLNRLRWAELVFKIIRETDYTLLDMMEQRVAEHPGQILFKDMSTAVPVEWTYEQIYRLVREIAAFFLKTGNDTPRVAIYTENCLEGACCDLACLMFDIFDTPISPHFKQEVLVSIFNALKIKIALADTPDRINILKTVREQTEVRFSIFSLQPVKHGQNETLYLIEEAKKLTQRDTEKILARRIRRSNDHVATTMFTSGSSGLPKGVSFSVYNIVTKRFARAAALPEVGNVTFLCYLPLYHTFGRYLELTGSIYWHGTYVFAGNTSAETLLALFPKVNPSGFISIPLRWQELYERCLEKTNSIESKELKERAIREVIGYRLQWGLSAAGYLDPSVFRFFNQHGIRLNSGFGMTEATGGITMTPPGAYVDGSVGIPLPGVMTRLSADKELEISGHYIGRYLEAAPPEGIIPRPESPENDWWLSTGDVFRISRNGYYEIVDRVKDIYKNNRGQTVAPQIIEKKFNRVPGIKNVFLVGDNRPYNVLLIVPDTSGSFYASLKGGNIKEYYHQIVMAANADVAPYERVINFALVDREFSIGKGELTAKKSYNRKVIESHFKEVIESLYQSNFVNIECPDFSISIPKWFFRDLGILEQDICYRKSGLVNKRSNKTLIVKRLKDDLVRIGDFGYHIEGKQIDLGLISRQPALWLGNPEIIAFCPVREGWDLPMGNFSATIRVIRFKQTILSETPVLKSVRDNQVVASNNLVIKSFFADFQTSYDSIEELGKMLLSAEPRLAGLLRGRLEALAYHPDEEIRCLAYRLILLKAPTPEDIRSMPLFIESGLTFLNERSIREIAVSNFGKHRLDALKQRLYWYRTRLIWPASPRHRRAFGDVLSMLYNFALKHLDYYVPVRAELSRWILHKQDPFLSRLAEKYFHQLADVFEQTIEQSTDLSTYKDLASRLVFEHGISDAEKKRLLRIFSTTTFLKESVLLTFNEGDFEMNRIPGQGIWVLRLLAYKEFKHYRLSINTDTGKHFDLHVVMSENPKFRPKPETFYWLASLAGFPYGPAVASQLGSSRPALGVLSTQYIGGLTAWDKIRELSEIHRSAGYINIHAWKKIFVRAFTVIFKAWHHSGFQIVPGSISPSNVSIPEMDFRESAVILSLAGWSPYRNTLSLIAPMLQDYYCKTASIYPWCRSQLDVAWIFDACMEAFGKPDAMSFFKEMKVDLERTPLTCFDSTGLLSHLTQYMDTISSTYYIPVALTSAIDQYLEWYRMNPLITYTAKEQTITELLELYRLHDQGEFIRYYFFRYTYFSDSSLEIREHFDALLRQMEHHREGLAIQLLELSDLQSLITDEEDKKVFGKMVFPKFQNEQSFDFLKTGENPYRQLVVRFTFHDRMNRKYLLREPVEARETGQLYQLFFRENYPKEISDKDHQYVLTDENENVIGGMTFRFLDEKNVLLDGVVVMSSLQGQGIASGMITNFFSSMASRGIETVKAHFLFGNYYLKHFFEVDKQWGALIKRLN